MEKQNRLNGWTLVATMVIIRRYIARYLRTLETFRARDPWNQDRETTFEIVEYVMMPEAFKRAVDSRLFQRRFGLQSEIDGVERLLPDSLVYLWKTGMAGTGFVLSTPSQSLPQLLKLLEPRLYGTDYIPMLEHLCRRRWLFWMGFGLLFLVPIWSLTVASLHFGIRLPDTWWMLAACIEFTALMFLVDWRGFQHVQKRRIQQMNWALGKDVWQPQLNAGQFVN